MRDENNMKVTIVNSPLFRDRNNLYDEDSLPPIGLGIIATSLQQNGIDVELIDAVHQRIPLDALIEMLDFKQSEFIAMNVFTTNKELVRELLESLNCKTRFILGGLATKELYKEIVNWKTKNQIDIVIGDGEIITIDLVLNQIKEQPFYEKEMKRVYLVDEKSQYLVKDISNIPLNRDFFSNEPVEHPLGFSEANIITSRGCVYNCTFCAAARSLNRAFPIREKSEQSIIEELKEIRNKYPDVNSIRVLDDLFLKSKDTVLKAIKIFSEFDLQWRSMAHVMTFNNVEENTMQCLQRSGCFELFIGVESGSPKVLQSINKTKNIETILKNLSSVFRAGINIKAYFIYGFPGETIEDMDMTYSLAQKLKLLSLSYGVNFRTSVFQYRPYHGTEIYHDLEVSGIDLDVEQMQPNRHLSSLVGRSQFNFHNGNYSEVESGDVHNYIYRTLNLNDGKLFAGLKSEAKAKS